VTKPTGRPRGRPRKWVPAVARLQRGRPSVPLTSDPDRYLIALMDAHATVNGTSERAAAEFVSAMTVGNELELSEQERRPIEGYVQLKWGPTTALRNDGAILNTKRGSSAATIKGRAATLREKSRKWSDPDSIKWRCLMTLAVACGLKKVGTRSAKEAKTLAHAAANLAGEGLFATSTLLPMIDLLYGD